jgi:hypothetical protein
LPASPALAASNAPSPPVESLRSDPRSERVRRHLKRDFARERAELRELGY